MDTLSLFSKLKLPIPTTAADVPSLAETVAQKKADFEAKQVKALEAGDEDAGHDEDEPDMPPTPPETGAGASSSAAEESRDAASTSAVAAAAVSVSMRCDEAFGTVLVELAAH